MNKKLLFAAMSLAALTACTDNDFESQQLAEEVSPVQFEVINNNDAFTRASWNASADKVVWSANDGDLFTLYHGAVAPDLPDYALTGYQNATYTAKAAEGSPATLFTPSMILPGSAIMVWPVDTTFRETLPAAKLTVKIPADQPADVENQIPYVSDLINIGAYGAYNEDPEKGPVTAWNTAGYVRKYPVYMRPMASQLNLKADYAGTDATIATLYKGGTAGLSDDEAIKEITVTSVELLTKDATTTPFTTEIPLKFTEATVDGDKARWNAKEQKNAWSHVTGFDIGNIADGAKVAKLTTKCLVPGNKGAKFLILPQAKLTTGVADAGVVVNTYYGKVVIANPTLPNPHASKYTMGEYEGAWYRYVGTRVAPGTDEENASATAAEPAGSDNAGKYLTIAKSPAMGMQQTINYMSAYKRNDANSIVNTEPIGVALTRYVKVYLNHLDMSGLHVKDDKQLRDVARVWKTLGLDPVTVFLDDDEEGEGDFHITQKTIEVINEVNKDVDANSDNEPDFRVKPCQLAGEKCNKIIITGASYKQDVQDIAFITFNGTFKATVELAKETTAWQWKGAVKVAAAGVDYIINKGTMENATIGSDAVTLKTEENNGTQNNVLLKNYGTWNVKAGKFNVQFNVTNFGTVNIAKGAEYREDGATHIFRNGADTKPQRFLAAEEKEVIGKVDNKGVFAALFTGKIYNYGLIEHADKDAKTYITSNETGGDFSTAFGASNLMGRINLPYSNKEEDNISISAAADKGFVSVTVDPVKDGYTVTDAEGKETTVLDASVVGERVNYIIVNSGINTIAAVSGQVKYLEINEPGKEVVWSVAAPTHYEGLVVLSDVNIKLNTQVTATTTYLGKNATMYVAGKFNKNIIDAIPATIWNGYYGNTFDNVATNYVYFGE